MANPVVLKTPNSRRWASLLNRLPWVRLLALAVITLGVCNGCASTQGNRLQLERALNKHLGDVSGPIHYFAKHADLNDDGLDETIVHIAGPMVCGTGGCNTAVFTPGPAGPDLVAWISVNRPPVIVAESSSNGWRDLIVRVSGGGIIPGYAARLRYDGKTYPSNPTVLPAERMDTHANGQIAIPEFQSFTEGRVLRAGR